MENKCEGLDFESNHVALLPQVDICVSVCRKSRCIMGCSDTIFVLCACAASLSAAAFPGTLRFLVAYIL